MFRNAGSESGGFQCDPRPRVGARFVDLVVLQVGLKRPRNGGPDRSAARDGVIPGCTVLFLGGLTQPNQVDKFEGLRLKLRPTIRKTLTNAR